MTDIPVPDRMPAFDETAAQTRATGSSIRLAQPLRDGVNHLLGYRKRRLVHLRRRDEPALLEDESGGFMTYRHPNADFLHFWIELAETGNSEAYVEIQAGTGDAVQVGPGYGGIPIGGDEYECLAPWGESDAGYQEVTITSDEVVIMGIMGHELYSPVLYVPTQLGLLSYDPSYPQGGMREGYYIIGSDTAGPRGVVKRTRDAWDHAVRQASSWWRTDGFEVDVAVWTNPFIGDTLIFHRARRKKTETIRAYRVYARTYQSAGSGGYQWRISSTTNTLTTGTLTNTVATWTLLTGLLVLTSADDTLTFEMRRMSGSPPNQPITVDRLSIIEEYI